MTRGTTPNFTITMIGITTLAGTSLYVTLKQGCVLLTIENDRLTIEDNKISFTLTQTEMLMFRQGTAKLQVRGVKDGTAWASKIKEVEINMILKDGVIS